MKKQDMNTTTTTTTTTNNNPATDAEKMTISRVPVVAEKDATANVEHINAAPMNTTETGAPVVAVTPAAKTPADITREHRNAARKVAADAWKKKYNGNPAAALAARVITETDAGNVSAHDIMFSYTDADGKKCNARGTLRITALLSADAARTVREHYTTIAAHVVSFHNARNAGTGADAENERAAEKAAIMPAFNAILTAYGITAGIKTHDAAAVIETAYLSNAAGNDDMKKAALIPALENVAARLMRKQERRNDYARRVKAADDKKAAKKAAADAVKAAAKKNAPAAKKPAKTGKKAAKK